MAEYLKIVAEFEIIAAENKKSSEEFNFSSELAEKILVLSEKIAKVY